FKEIGDIYESSPLYGDTIYMSDYYRLSLRLSKSPIIQDRPERNSMMARYSHESGIMKSKTFSYKNNAKDTSTKDVLEFCSSLPQTGTIIDINIDTFLK